VQELTVNLELFTTNTAHIYRNLYPLYLHDLSAFKNKSIPNEHGVLFSDESKTLEAQMDNLSYWLNDPFLKSYLIRVNGLPAGFSLVTTAAYSPNKATTELHEFFLLHPFRGRGIGAQAVSMTLVTVSGSWMLRVLPRNTPALAFWRKTLKRYANDLHEEILEDGLIQFVFESKQTVP
jgi:predicted acetyltransferase